MDSPRKCPKFYTVEMEDSTENIMDKIDKKNPLEVADVSEPCSSQLSTHTY